MTQQDAESIIAIATLAALADGQRDAGEQQRLADAASRLGFPAADGVVRQAALGQLAVPALVARLSGSDARIAAYETAASVCYADGAIGAAEAAFLQSLAATLGIDPRQVDQEAATAATAATAASSFGASAAPAGEASPADAPALDEHILDQAILTAALELLPDRLANMAIVPLQLRLVRHVGGLHGHAMDANQIKDLAGAFGIGAAAQLLESVVRSTFGGLAGGLLGGMFGGLAGTAAGGAVTFATTYALGHASRQYYAQGRTMSTDDMKALFTRFQGEAQELFPKVQTRVSTLARANNLDAIMRMVRG